MAILDGMAAVFAALDKTLQQVSGQVNDAIQGAGIECQAEAKKACPVDTGRLRSSIQYTPGELEAKVGTNVEYAVYVEMGTHKMAARPYMQPAFEIARQHLLDELKGIV